MLWREYWSCHESDEENSPPIFKTDKTNLPPFDHPRPPPLTTFLNGVKSELMDPLNRNNCRPNLPFDEMKALKELINLQNNNVIVMKACDKGAGIIILNYDAYMLSCKNHLCSMLFLEHLII